MVQIKNIHVNEINFHKELKTNAALHKALDLVPSAKDLLPNKSKYTVEFEMHETNSDFANAIRRCLVSETPVISFDFDEYNIDIDDPFILSDYIKQQINLLPVNQDVTNPEKYTFQLNKKNNDDEICNVYSHDITCSTKGVDIKNIVNNIIICRLRPSRYININNIKLVEGVGRENQGAFSLCSNVTYKILDVEPLIRDRDKVTGKSSMVSNPTKFYISYSTHRNTEKPLEFLKKAINTLINRSQTILQNLKDNKLSITEDGDVRHIRIEKENYTLCNLIARYIYLNTDKNIKYVNAGILHPQTYVGVINIAHPEWKQIVLDAIKKIIDDFKKCLKEI